MSASEPVATLGSRGRPVAGSLEVWRSGLLDLVPGCIDHAVVSAAAGLGRNGWGAALLLRDVSPWLVPELGTGPAGRTILLDWSYPGRGPVAGEEDHGVDTSGWWEEQARDGARHL